jgi:hypothetical protein
VELVGFIFFFSGRMVLVEGKDAAALFSSDSVVAAGSGVPGAMGASEALPAASAAIVVCPPPPPPSFSAGGSGGQLTSTSTLLCETAVSNTGIFQRSRKSSNNMARAIVAVMAEALFLAFSENDRAIVE